jgi:alpha-galactosidase
MTAACSEHPSPGRLSAYVRCGRDFLLGFGLADVIGVLRVRPSAIVLRDQLDELLTANEIDYIKWDHNRDLLDAGSPVRDGSPAAHRQYLAFYSLLDELRARHPKIAWESCASGGGRADLGVIERIQRIWTSDGTDALARQHIQRWTAQTIAPEYLGAHVASTVSHQTGRTLSLDFRAATALFGAFGVEWDLTAASEDELTRLAQWCATYKHYRHLRHTGRTIRIETNDPAVLAHGVIAADGSAGLIAHVQLDESEHNRGVTIRVPHLIRQQAYRLEWTGRAPADRSPGSPEPDPAGPTRGLPVSGAILHDVGIWLPRCPPETIRLIGVTAKAN